MSDDLRRQMDRAVQLRVRAPVAAVMKRMTLEAFSRVVQRSPVDTGRFRGNWQVGVGVRPSGDVAAIDKGAAGSPPSGAGMSTALSRVAAVGPETMETYVVNNLPYADRLENGHSQQAPNGMVEVTVAELKVAAREIIRQATS